MKVKVAITRCDSYNPEPLEKAISQVMESSDFPEVEGKTVLLKPNILYDAPPERCVTTNPEFLRVFVRLLKKRQPARILVGDSPGMQSKSFCGKACGIWEICEEEGLQWVDFTKDTLNVKIPGTKITKPVTSWAQKADVLISLPKMKTHQLMYATGGVKNLFGLIPGLNKSQTHLSCPSRQSFSKLICGLYRFAKPSYCLMDAVIAMQGAGPANGTPYPAGLILGSTDCPAVDWAQAVLMGYDPNMLPLLTELKKQGLLAEQADYPLLDPYKEKLKGFELIEIREKTKFVRSLVLPFFTSSILRAAQKKEPAPEFDSSKCIRCCRCVNICPPKALKMQQSGVERDKNLCIRCYCCHEVCPVNAISIPKRSG